LHCFAPILPQTGTALLTIIASSINPSAPNERHDTLAAELVPTISVSGSAVPLFRAGTRVLVAEDDRVSQAVLTLILQKLGLEVHLACDGKKAFELVREISPDLVLMDMQMPVMDGHEAIRAIRADRSAPQPPVVVLSANLIPEARHAELTALGVSDFLIKPVNRARLNASLVRLLPKA